MQANRGQHTGPEIAVRKLLHHLGFRFRLLRYDLPGRPDIVLPGRRMVVFVHGCFWHHHHCQRGRLPKTRREFWEAKFKNNNMRDERNEAALLAAGWTPLTVWECELTDRDALSKRLVTLLRKGDS